MKTITVKKTIFDKKTITNVVFLVMPYIIYGLFPKISPFVFIIMVVPFINNYVYSRSRIKIDILFMLICDIIICIIDPTVIIAVLFYILCFAFTVISIIKIIYSNNTILEQEADEDFLTGVYNRRYLDAALDEMYAKFKIENIPLSMLMLDIDKFKHCNDSCGHQVGDEILKQLAEILKQCVRNSDIIVRYGGEEFAILLPASSITEAQLVATRIQYKLKNYVFDVKGQKIICDSCKKTVSIGLAELDDHTNSPWMLIKHADIALYEAKKTRNTICVHQY